MKKIFLSIAAVFAFMATQAQKYPDPEFTNEIYYFKKDSSLLVRLEKGSSKMDTKMKMGGFGGSESGYEMEGERSTVRFTGGSNLSFVFSNGAASRSSSSTAKRDSMLRANGVDPSMMESMSDPSNMITLYKAETAKSKRKILMQKSPGASPFGSKKMQSSDKYTFSVKKVREGYWELVVDKPLPKGEYAFTMMNMGMGSMDGSTLLFAFAID